MRDFDTKHAGRELRGLIDDIVAQDAAPGAKARAARTIGLDPHVAGQLMYRNQEGVSRKSLEKVCQKIGVSVDAFMSDTSYPVARKRAGGGK